MGDQSAEDDWISWAEAAELIGISLQRIEWWKRRGRIEHRAHNGVRATLRRSSVLELGAWLQERDREREAIANAREQRLAEWKRPVGWLSAGEVADRLGVTRRTVARYARSIDGVQRGRRLWFSPEAVELLEQRRAASVRRRAEEAMEWTTLREAADIVGCHQATVLRYVANGMIERRDVDGPKRSLSRKSVEAFAAKWRAAHQRSGRRPRIVAPPPP